LANGVSFREPKLWYNGVMESDLKELIVVEGMVPAEIIRSKLKSYGIDCLIQAETAGRLFGITLNGLGKARIMVRKEDHSKALKLINT